MDDFINKRYNENNIRFHFDVRCVKSPKRIDVTDRKMAVRLQNDEEGWKSLLRGHEIH